MEEKKESIQRECFTLAELAESCPELLELKNIRQNPDYHAEGDVYRHTEMVCEELLLLPEWQKLTCEEQRLLFLAAAFHDIGKAISTRQEDGIWVSPGHTKAGEKIFRGMVYRDSGRFALTIRERETAAKLIRYHGLPVWFWTRKRPEAALLTAAECVPMYLLYLLSRADTMGREGTGRDNLKENVELFADCAKELGIWRQPYQFANPYARYQYFHREDMWQGAELYDDTEFDVILLSGLPLAGKDSWIAEHGTDMPVISLDDIREERGTAPEEGSGRVVREAMERARTLLRRKEPFIWNATNIMQETRQKLVRLFAGYGARVHILYLEVPYMELAARNRTRERHIPEAVLEKMIRKLEPPEPWEAYEVKWLSCKEDDKQKADKLIKNKTKIK